MIILTIMFHFDLGSLHATFRKFTWVRLEVRDGLFDPTSFSTGALRRDGNEAEMLKLCKMLHYTVL